MERPESNENYFSSLVLEECDSHTEVPLPRQKLKVKRKAKEKFQEGSSINASRFKLKVKYDGLFRPINNGTKQKYCFGRQKTIYLDKESYNFNELLEEVTGLYHLDDGDFNLLMYYLDASATTQSFVQIVDNESYNLMVTMYEEKREAVIFVSKELLDGGSQEETTLAEDLEFQTVDVENYEEESDYCHSEESYHSLHSELEDGDENETDIEYEGEFYSYDKDDPQIVVDAKFPHVTAFRRALNHYAVLNNFEYKLIKSEQARVTARCANLNCSWRIHASVAQDGITFVVKTMQPNHNCSGVNLFQNKHATQGWVADRIINDLKKKVDISAQDLKDKLKDKYSISVPYHRVWEGKELAMQEIYGKWHDSFIQIGALKEEIVKRNPESVVEFGTEIVEGNRHFQRFFVALGACIIGFHKGCRPYIALDACHMKGKWKGVVATAIGIDGNNYMFPVAFAVMEGETESSWEWFLRALHKAIEMPEGLVISSDMQKGLQNALAKVYPCAEHRECMRHLFSNFKKHFHGDLFKFGLWGAARTYSPTCFNSLMNEINMHCPSGIQYLNSEHKNIWTRSKFGTTSKCDYLTNNIAETFNAWISEERHKPVIDLIDSIRMKIMVKFDNRRRTSAKWKGQLVPKVADEINRISRSLHSYEVHRSENSCAEVQKNGRRWTINLDNHECSCRAWQVRGIPCLHAAAFIASLRNPKWENYVDSYFTVNRFKMAYAMGVAPMPSRDEWMKVDLGYKMLPPTLKRPTRRPRKNRIKSSYEQKKKRHKCTRCNQYDHHKSTCKKPVPLQENEGASQTNQITTNRSTTAGSSRSKKTACPPSIFRILQEEA